MYIIFDTETTGLPKDYNASVNNIENWPRLVQLSWQCYDNLAQIISSNNFIIKPDGFDIPFNSVKLHGITTNYALLVGKNIKKVINLFIKDLNNSLFLIGHNLKFDINVLSAEFIRLKLDISCFNKKIIDTKLESTEYCALKSIKIGKYKWPTLSELYQKLFGIDYLDKHNAMSDVKATAKCFFKLINLGIISQDKIKNIQNYNNHLFKKQQNKKIIINNNNLKNINYTNIKINNYKNYHLNKDFFFNKNIKYSNLHNHTSFSLLSSTIKIKSLIDRAIKYNMPAVGITDYGNMMGAFEFLDYIEQVNLKLNINSNKKFYIKGIIGCEFFISENYLKKKFSKSNPDIVYHQVLLAKNKKGYINLTKLSSKGFIDGYYSGHPRINHELINLYKDNLIALSGDLNSQIPYTILNKGEIEGEKIFLWWKKIFKEDFYIELFRHNIEEENYINNVLLSFAKKHKVKYIIQNNTFYLNQEDHKAHDILLCVKNGEKKNTPIGVGRGFRFGLPNNNFYFKSINEIKKIFVDLQQGFQNLEELINKIETYDIKQKVLLPKYNIPNKFKYLNKEDIENKYLKYLTYKGAKKKYLNINLNIKKRIEFELNIIKKIGYPGYFLIVQEIIYEAKKMNISIGPGRGSVAGSIVAYCIGITNIDPIKYGLLFERFLNLNRISLPDIDIDFDDKGRDNIIKWVVNKYGKNHVAQIITYGTMAAKTAIRDTARVLNLPIAKAIYLSKMVPNNISLKDILYENINVIKKKFNSEEIQNILTLRQIITNNNSLEKEVLIQAQIIEGSLRNTGIHPCGIIITPIDLTNYIPLSTSKDSELFVTQFDNNVVEKIGLLKIDFLGLKTLTIIKDTLNQIKNKDKLNNFFDLNDQKTYNLFQKGSTIAVFQYESNGMQKYLKQLQPDKFEDLIAMNALYRPGPMHYIPNFISRKNKIEKIIYDLPIMKNYLNNTYGITIYQEQVMILSQVIAGFTKNSADILRKAIGKKEKNTLQKMQNNFIQGGINNGYKKNILEKIWNDWKSFASYAFNKSHSTCYAYIAFQTAYLKTHYPAEYMASVLSNNMNNIKNINFFISECKFMNVLVLNPDLNESDTIFIVNKNKNIRFGLTAIKGLGELAAKKIIEERIKNGEYKSIFDFVERIDLKLINKKTLENLILAGAFDFFKKIHRRQYLYQQDNLFFLEKIISYGIKYQNIKNQSKLSLFQNINDIEIKKPLLPNCSPWNNIDKLSKEKEVLGIYVSSHPLDDYFYEVKKYKNNISINYLNKYENNLINKEVNICGIITSFEYKISIKNGLKYVIFIIEDYLGTKQLKLFGNEYLKYKNLIFYNSIVLIKIFIKKSYNNNFYIKILDIQPLNTLLNNIVKGLVLFLNKKNINHQIINQIDELFNNNIGNKIAIIKFDNNQNKLEFFNKKYLININKKLLDNINNIKLINYCLI